MEKGLVTVLKAVSPQIAGNRIYPYLPQKVTFPTVRFQRLSVDRITSVDGQNIGPNTYYIQIDCFGRTYQSAKDTADAVRSQLHLYSGSWGSSICRGCFLETENDFNEQDGDELTFWVTQRYAITTNDD